MLSRCHRLDCQLCLNMECSPDFLVAAREARTSRLAAQGLKMLETLVDDRNKDRLHSNGTWVKWADAAPEAVYWRLQHFYCRMREHICQEKAVDAQKVFKERIWGAKDPEKRGLAHRALQPADIHECIFDWVRGLQGYLRTIVDTGSVLPAAQAIRKMSTCHPTLKWFKASRQSRRGLGSLLLFPTVLRAAARALLLERCC